MNEKGFAVSGVIYTLMVLFIILIIALLSMFNSRKVVLDELKSKVLNEMNVKIDLAPKVYTPTATNDIIEHRIDVKGYYNVKLTSSNGSTLETILYFNEGEKIYLKIGSKNYNSGIVEIFENQDDATSFLKLTNTTYNLNKKYKNREYINLSYIKNNNTFGDGIISITYLDVKRKNTSLNQVRYIKDCISGNNDTNSNTWSEIKAVVVGENKAFGKLANDSSKASITDGNIETNYTSDDNCVIVDLERTWNIEYLIVNHEENKKYYNHKIYVSTDGNNYKTIYNFEEKEAKKGIAISAYENDKVLKVGNIYLPVKVINDRTWLRIFHHNNMNGTVLWSAKSQVIAKGGYDEIHKQSGLYYLNDLKASSSKYEFRLEYPDISTTKYNHWTQTSDITSTSSISGFTNIKTDYQSSYAPFNGLKFNGTNSIISGNTGWYYAIGATKSINNGILGYNSESIKGSVDLWINIDNYLKQ